MMVEILYVPGCPGRAAARAQARRWLQQQGASATIREVRVTSAAQARRLKFRASPTIRIDGRDAGGPEQAPGTGVYCRLVRQEMGDGHT